MTDVQDDDVENKFERVRCSTTLNTGESPFFLTLVPKPWR